MGMKMIGRFLAIAMGVGWVLVSPGLDARPQAPAGLARHAWTVDGTQRSALVFEPAGLKPQTPAPLVFVFHGHGGTSANVARTFHTHELWPEAVVIYPQGLPTIGQITDPQGNLPGWQHAVGGDGDRDLHFVDAMFAWAKERFTVDPARTFAAGHSNGGSMVYVLWVAQPDRFAAFAPSSSVFPLAAITKAKPKPAFIVAGKQDPLVPFELQQLSLAGVLRLNGADRTDQPWSGSARRHAPLGAGGGAEVIAYIHPGGHAMPPDAGELIVKFFKSVSHAIGAEGP
jgi:polyhydroxybutyrate depolymerase